MRVAGYLRVSTAEQGRSGLGLDAQRAMVEAACASRGWDLVDVVVDTASAGDLNRPGLRRVLDAIVAGEVEGLVVAKADRLTRRLADLLALVEWLDSAQAVLVALDLGVDTSTPVGRMMQQMLGVLAEFEREKGRERTTDALAALRANGRPISGPSVIDRPDLAERIAAMRAAGATYQAIADALNAEGVPTLRGGSRWRVSSVQTAAGYVRPPAKRKAPDLPAIPRRRRAKASA